LNIAERGGDYGYPDVFGFPPPGSASLPPVALFRNEDVPTGLTYYESGELPQTFHGAAIVTLWSATGESRLVAVRLTETASGYVSGEVVPLASRFGNAIAVAADSRGRLYVADYSKHTIFVITGAN
jgi:glucose/arabinose dehydrogenase